MTTASRESELLATLKQRTSTLSGLPPCATMADVERAEAALGFALPPLYVRIVTEVANGGFGPGNGIMGVPPRGFADPEMGLNIVDAYNVARDDSDTDARWPNGLLFLVYWSLGDDQPPGVSCVDCLAPEAPIVTPKALQDGIEYHLTSPSLLEWLASWAGGEAKVDYATIVAYEQATNPFTKETMQFPIYEVTGAILDYSARR
jgi:hypothetical protein